MKIILTDDVVGVGDIGEFVSVKAGYARNFLIPNGLAIEAEAASAKAIEHRMRQIEVKKNRMKRAAEQRAGELSGKTIEMELRVGTGGKVFGSITTRHVVEKLSEQGIEIDRRRVLLNEPIRKLGPKEVGIKLHAEVIAKVTVNVSAAEASLEEESQETAEAKERLEEAAEIREVEEAEAFEAEEEALAEEEPE